jgi:hypothetical protein
MIGGENLLHEPKTEPKPVQKLQFQPNRNFIFDERSERSEIFNFTYPYKKALVFFFCVCLCVCLRSTGQTATPISIKFAGDLNLFST